MDKLLSPSPMSAREIAEYLVDVRSYLADLTSAADKELGWYIEAVLQAVKAAETGSRGVGAVLIVNDQIVAKGHNDVQNLENEWRHIAHAETQTIRHFHTSKKYKQRKNEENLRLISTLTPCFQCMISGINEKICHIEAISPDWTGGASLEIVSALYPGWKKHIEKIGMRFVISEIADAKLGHELRQLSWILSRINKYSFDYEEYRGGLENRTTEAFVTMAASVIRVLGKEHAIDDPHIEDVVKRIEGVGGVTA